MYNVVHYSLQCTTDFTKEHPVHCTFYNALYIVVYIVHCTMYSVQYFSN